MVLPDKSEDLTTTASPAHGELSHGQNCLAPRGDGVCFIGASPTMQALRQYAETLAKIDSPILITGEIGTGKETVARLVHCLSQRSAAPFLAITCAGMPAHALEEELFGRASDASAPLLPDKAPSCQHGTLFLSDLADMPLASQAQLIHMLGRQRFFGTRTNAPIDADVRILAATSFPLERAIAEQKLRNDLYYALSAFTLHVPPLRERREDIPCLVGHFLEKAASHFDLPPRPLSPEAKEALEAHFWPGNVRQLQNVIRQYAVVGDEKLLLESLHQNSKSYNQHTANDGEQRVQEQKPGLKSLVRIIRDKTEKDLISSALEQTGWNRKLAAQLLNISYRNLLYKIEEYNLSPAAKRNMVG